MSRFATARLGAEGMVDVTLGQSPPSSSYNNEGKGLPFYQGKVDFGRISPETRVWCSGGRQFARPEDVLIAVRAPVGDVNVAATHCVIGRGLAALRAKERLDPWYLFFALKHVRSSIEARATGSTFSSINKNALLETEIPCPRIGEQQSIVRLLRLVLTAIEASEAAQKATERLKGAVAARIFACGLRGEPQKQTEIGPLPESYCCCSIGEHFAVVSGGTPSRSNPEYWHGGSVPWVKTTEVDYGVIDQTEECITQLGLFESAAKMLPPGTVLMAMYGQGVTRGKVAMLGVEASCNQACAAMTASDGAVLPRYLFHFLSYRYEQIRQLAHGGQQQNLNLDIVRALPIAFPKDHQEQGRIVETLDEIDRKIALDKRKRILLEELFAALLNGLMTGDISVSDLNLPALNTRSEPTEASKREGVAV